MYEIILASAESFRDVSQNDQSMRDGLRLQSQGIILVLGGRTRTKDHIA